MKQSIIALILAFASFNLWAGVDTSTDENGVILAGYDTVAYHTDGKPAKGKAEITAVYNDAIYRFANKQNRDLFIASPEKYAPAYGGFCALGAAFGKKFDVDGKAFEIIDGVLYVNKDKSIAKTWQKDIPGNLKKSEENWPSIANVAAKFDGRIRIVSSSLGSRFNPLFTRKRVQHRTTFGTCLALLRGK